MIVATSSNVLLLFGDFTLSVRFVIESKVLVGSEEVGEIIEEGPDKELSNCPKDFWVGGTLVRKTLDKL